MDRPWTLKILIILSFGVFLWSAWKPHDYPTWLLETLPAILGFIVIFCLRKKFPLSNLLLGLICIHAIVLCMGGKYTYAETPIGFWFRDLFDLQRNPYDRLGHLLQGLTPALLAREILIRRGVLPRGKWLNFLVICICLAFSAFYELIEWWVALIYGGDATAFLAAQGDPFDTQADMFCALIGASFGLILVAPWQDRSFLLKIKRKPNPEHFQMP